MAQQQPTTVPRPFCDRILTASALHPPAIPPTVVMSTAGQYTPVATGEEVATLDSPLASPQANADIELVTSSGWRQCGVASLSLLCLILSTLLLLTGAALYTLVDRHLHPLSIAAPHDGDSFTITAAPTIAPTANTSAGGRLTRSFQYVPSCNALDAGIWLNCSDTYNFTITPLTTYEQSHYCTVEDSGSQRSTHNFPHNRRHYYHVYDPVGPIPYYNSTAARALLQNRRLLFIGDSTTQELVTELVSFLEGAPDDVDYRSSAWSYVRKCDGPKSSLLYRSLRTDQYPSPALSLFNISIQMMWTGYLTDDCANNSPIEDQITPHFAAKLHLHSHSCANRTAHLQLLADLYRQEAVRSLLRGGAEDSTERREALFQMLLSMSAPETGDYEPLLNASLQLMTDPDFFTRIGSYMQLCDPSVWTSEYVQTVGDTQRTMDWSPLPQGRFALNFSTIPVPRTPSFDYVMYSSATTHSLLRQPLSYERPVPEWASLYARVVSGAMTTVHTAAREAVIWRDGSPDSLFSAIRYLNNEARSMADTFPVGRQVNWCVMGPLSNLLKGDPRHCSFKDWNYRHERTVYCHQAVQLLLGIIAKHSATYS